MTGRERLTAVYHGARADRVPWAPLIMADTLATYPDEIRAPGPVAFTRAVGGDVLHRCGLCRIEHPCVQVTEHVDGQTRSTQYRTPFGTLGEVCRGGRIMERQIQRLADYDAFRYVWENQQFSVDEGRYTDAVAEVGDAGIVTASVGPTPVQRLLQYEMGVEGFVYHLADYPRQLEDLMAAMHAKDLELYRLVAASPAEFVMIYENTSTTMISPAIYERYSLEHVAGFVRAMHDQGKVAIVHMCGKIDKLLDLVRQTDLDAVDCLTPAPTGDVDFARAFDVLGDGVTIHGLLDPSQWIHRPADEIEQNIARLLTPDVLRKPFVFCTAADGLPGIPIEKFRRIAEIIQRYTLAAD